MNHHLLYEAVKQYRAGGRAGTAITKNRANVSGSGRKPWRQKGTGRARVGEIRTPLWRHGGTVFGPVPRDYSYSMPKKAREAALRSALSQRVADGGLKVVDRLEMPKPRTKDLKAILAGLGATGKTLVVDHRPRGQRHPLRPQHPGRQGGGRDAGERLRRARLPDPARVAGGPRQAGGAAHAVARP